ncbi:MAG: thioredoxin family protein [Cyanobacteriota bacterium]
MSLMEKTGTPVGSYAPDFELPGIDDQVHHLSRYLEQWRGVGVVFMCNHCPNVNSYLDKLKQIQAQFEPQGFTLVGINASDPEHDSQESFKKMKQLAQEWQLNFPYLWDSTQDVAHSFGAQKTPEVFVVDKEGVIRYSGLIDNHLQGLKAESVPYLQNAIAALLCGQEIYPKSTQTMGTPLKWRPPST